MRPLRAIIPALLLAAAVVVGGVAGVLAGFLAVLMVVDRLLDRVIGGGGWSMAEAQQDFRRMTRRRGARCPLAYLAVDAGWAAVAGRRRLGVRTIGLDSIVGTVDRHKAAAFDGCFRPPDYSRGRWTQLDLAARRGAALPPISVYRVGDEHFVRDGHHRVSVARALGADQIEAEVVELGR